MSVREVMRQMGRKGGLARAKSMTAEKRQEIAIKASQAAKAARKKKAEKKADDGEGKSGKIRGNQGKSGENDD